MNLVRSYLASSRTPVLGNEDYAGPGMAESCDRGIIAGAMDHATLGDTTSAERTAHRCPWRTIFIVQKQGFRCAGQTIFGAIHGRAEVNLAAAETGQAAALGDLRSF
jgi:hypothetical protein